MSTAEFDTTTDTQLRHFSRSCVLFVAPMVLFVAPALGILALSGESLIAVDDILDRSDRHPLLVGFAYNEQNYGYLKYRRLTTLPRQSVIAVGSSRVLGFRREMFTADFYNAGYTVTTVWDIRNFLSLVPESRLPEVVIVGLDQFMFNPQYNESTTRKSEADWCVDSSGSLQSAVKLTPKVYKDIARGRLHPGAVLLSAGSPTDLVEAIGLNGVVNRKGFRNDGSFVYGSQVDRLLNSDESARDYRFADTLDRVAQGNRLFQYGHSADETAIEEVDRLLDFCHGRGIHVVAYLPPYADAVWDAMRASGEFEYVTQIEPALRPTFEQHGFELYAFHCMSDCGASDAEAIDGFHAGETVYIKLLVQMLRHGSVLNDFASLNELHRDERQVVNRYIAYPELQRSTRTAGGNVPVTRQ